MKAYEFLDYLIDRLGLHEEEVPLEIRYHMTEYADDYEIERRNAASIAHVFIRDMLKISDINERDILKKADKLADLYDCRVCVTAITQIYLRGIMEPRYMLESGRYVFGGREAFTQDEAKITADRIKRLISD